MGDVVELHFGGVEFFDCDECGELLLLCADREGEFVGYCGHCDLVVYFENDDENLP